MPIRVRSSFSDHLGTLVISDREAQANVEQPIIAGVASDLSEAKITIVGVPDKPGEAAAIFETIAAAGINIDMIVQNISAAATGRTDVTFTAPKADARAAVDVLEAHQDAIGFETLIADEDIAKISLIGAGMRSHPGVSATFFRALATSGVNVEMITTSEIRISIVTRTEHAAIAVRALHTAFGLDADGEAVVYGGTGR
jgi:aspartate kinase